MFSSVEENFIMSFLKTYEMVGYNNYIVHTNTTINNTQEIIMYFSKEQIQAVNNLSFIVNNGLCIKFDSITDVNIDNISDRYVIEEIDGVVVVSNKELIYTNAKVEYETTSIVINPNILKSGKDCINTQQILMINTFLLACLFLYVFIKSILKIKR